MRAPRRAASPRTVTRLATVNLGRTPGRTALAALAMAIATGSLTLLLAVTIDFHHFVVGTLLGNAVAVSVQPTDAIAIAAIIALGLASVADVLYLNLRDRADELATLHALGWPDRTVAALVGAEGLLTGAIGSLVGAAAGLAGVAAFVGAITPLLVATTVAAVAVTVALTAATSLLPIRWLRSLDTISLLAGE